jgi:hypothetical protein
MPERNAGAAARPVETAPTVGRARRPDRSRDRSVGWLVFAAVMIGVLGVLNVVYGIAAVSNSPFYVRDANYILGDLNAYGWFLTVVGAVQVCAALGILAWAEWARWVGMISAGVNAVLQLLVIPAAPLLAVTLYAVDLLVVYALVVYGGGRARATR